MRFEVLGPLRVVSDGGALPLTSGRQQALLVNLLIARGDVVASDRLIEAVWGTDLPSNPTNTLQHGVAQLRKILEPGRARSQAPLVLLSDGAGYRIDLSGHSFDVVEFEEAVAAARRLLSGPGETEAARRLESALELWRGPAYAGFEYAEFARGDAERLEELRVQARELLIDAKTAMDGPAAAIAELEALVAEFPYREAVWARLMRSLYQEGRQAEALRVYQSARRTLGDELGIEPSPELRELEEQILLQDPSLAVQLQVAVHNLPEPTTDLVGRDEALEELIGFLESTRLTTLLGPGGSGKTRLAIEAGRRVLGNYVDGAWLVRLDDLNDPELLATSIGSVLAMPENRDKPVLTTLTDYLTDKSMLIIVDNCEHLADSVADVIEAILEHCAGVTVLATSQLPLQLRGEQRVPLPPLRLPGEEGSPFGDIEAVPAVRLFLDRATAIDPGFDQGAASIAAVANIVSALDGMPLAIELAAARADLLTAVEIAKRLSDRFAVLNSAARDAPLRQQTLRNTVEWSYGLLEPDEQRFFTRLAVFPGSFDVVAAATVADVVEGEALALVGRLLQRSLLSRHSAASGTSHYRLLETLRVFGVEQLEDADELVAARDRHLDHYAELVRELDDRLQTADQMTAFAEVSEEQDNMRAAMAWSLESGRLGPGVSIAAWSARFWDWRGSLSEASTWMTRFLDAEPAEAIRDVALLTSWSGFFSWELGQEERAAELSAEGLRIATEHGDRLGLAASLTGKAMQARANGDPAEASRRNAEVREIAIELAQPWLQAWADNHDGLALLAAGHVAAAEAAAQQSLRAFGRLGDRRATGWALTVLAQIAHEQGRPERTVELAKQAVGVSIEAEDGRNAAWAMELAAEASREIGDHDEAARYDRSARELLDERGMATSPWRRFEA